MKFYTFRKFIFVWMLGIISACSYVDVALSTSLNVDPDPPRVYNRPSRPSANQGGRTYSAPPVRSGGGGRTTNYGSSAAGAAALGGLALGILGNVLRALPADEPSNPAPSYDDTPSDPGPATIIRRSCRAGYKMCGSGCAPASAICCGQGRYCPAGNICHAGSCLPRNVTFCAGGGYCNAGSICTSDRKCLPKSSINACSNGRYCAKGSACSSNGSCVPYGRICPNGAICGPDSNCTVDNICVANASPQHCADGKHVCNPGFACQADNQTCKAMSDQEQAAWRRDGPVRDATITPKVAAAMAGSGGFSDISGTGGPKRACADGTGNRAGRRTAGAPAPSKISFKPAPHGPDEACDAPDVNAVAAWRTNASKGFIMPGTLRPCVKIPGASAKEPFNHSSKPIPVYVWNQGDPEVVEIPGATDLKRFGLWADEAGRLQVKEWVEADPKREASAKCDSMASEEWTTPECEERRQKAWMEASDRSEFERAKTEEQCKRLRGTVVHPNEGAIPEAECRNRGGTPLSLFGAETEKGWRPGTRACYFAASKSYEKLTNPALGDRQCKVVGSDPTRPDYYPMRATTELGGFSIERYEQIFNGSL